MPYLRDFENDIFISYSHIDDEPLTEGQKGWISSFHASLHVRLAQLLGDEPRIWRDARLTGNSEFAPAIFKQFGGTGVLVSVLSPRYLNSSWCLDELNAFLQTAADRGGVTVENRSRVFKVIKTHVPRERHPAELQGVLGYEFYRIDQATGRPVEFLLDPSPDAVRNYWAKLEDLAYDIHELLKTLRAGREPVSHEPTATIYVAETTSELQIERDRVCRDLRQRGCLVLPDQPLPLRGGDIEAAVSDGLDRSAISVHVVGSDYGIVPERETHSVVHLQCELAGKVEKPGFSRVVWFHSGQPVADARHRAFLEDLRNAGDTRARTEFLEGDIEELKTFIQDSLSRGREAKPPAAAPEKASRHVYLICDPQDLDAVQPLYDCMYDRGYEVIVPASEEDEAKFREAHKESLVFCDAAVVYYGRASEIWVRTKVSDLIKARGYGRSQDMLARAVYRGSPRTPAKGLFKSREVMTLGDGADFSPEHLQPFFDLIESGAAGAGP